MTNIKIVVMEVRGSESSARENKWRIISRGIQSKLLPLRPTSPPSIAACFFFFFSLNFSCETVIRTLLFLGLQL